MGRKIADESDARTRAEARASEVYAVVKPNGKGHPGQWCFTITHNNGRTEQAGPWAYKPVAKAARKVFVAALEALFASQ